MVLQYFIIIILFWIKSFYSVQNETRITDEQRLLQKILENYDSASRPTFNASNTVQIKFQFTLIQIYKLVSIRFATVNSNKK